MKKIKKIVSVGMVFGCLSGCKAWEGLGKTEKGAIIGAGSGALIGTAVGGTKGALIGGAAGGIGGGVIGHQME